MVHLLHVLHLAHVLDLLGRQLLHAHARKACLLTACRHTKTVRYEKTFLAACQGSLPV